MPHRVQTNRSSTKNQRPAAGTREPGELYVNLADLQLGVTNATKNPQDLIAVRFFSSATDYSVGSFVIYSGVGYRAKEAITAGAFNAAQWDTINVTGSAEPPIAAGTTSQYWRGDKSWQLLDKTAVGLSNVDNTSDANKPVSSAQQTALNLKANLASPTLTGDPKAPTPAYPDSDTSIATTAFVSNNFATILSPTFGGDPRAPTQAPGDSDTSIATTAFVQGELADYAPIDSPVFVGDPRAPTPVPGDNDTSLATTAFVQTAVTGKITDAPSDGLTYGRKNASWATVIGGASMLDAPPDPPLQNGQLWFETDSGNTYAYYVDPSGTPGQWVQLSGSLAVPLPPSIDGALISDSVPVSAQPGQMWWQSSTGRLFVYFNDGTSSQWIQISGPLNPDHIASVTQDMWAGFKPTAQFAINDKADGSGTDRLTISDAGAVSTYGTIYSANTITGANLVTGGAVNATGNIATAALVQAAGGAYMGQSGAYYNFAWNATYVWRIVTASGRCEMILANNQRCYWDIANGAFVNLGPAYKPGGGAWLDSSDERIKNVLGDYEPGLDEVVQLRPVRYTFKGNDTSEAPQGERIAREGDSDPGAPEYEEAGAAPYHNSTHYDAAVSEQQFIGLIAQEVETVFPGMVTPRAGWIDGAEVDDLRDLDTTPLIFALINAVKTLAARVEALEGGSTLMAFDFPNAPTIGESFAPPGGPTYVWDGVTWGTSEVSPFAGLGWNKLAPVVVAGAAYRDFLLPPTTKLVDIAFSGLSGVATGNLYCSLLTTAGTLISGYAGTLAVLGAGGGTGSLPWTDVTNFGGGVYCPLSAGGGAGISAIGQIRLRCIENQGAGSNQQVWVIDATIAYGSTQAVLSTGNVAGAANATLNGFRIGFNNGNLDAGQVQAWYA